MADPTSRLTKRATNRRGRVQKKKSNLYREIKKLEGGKEMGVGGTITETHPRMIWSPSLGASFAVFHLHAFLNERARKEKEKEQEEKKGATSEGRRDENEVGTSIIFGGVVNRNLPFFLCVYYIWTGPQVGVFLILKLFPRSSCISETSVPCEGSLPSQSLLIFNQISVHRAR